MTLADAKRREKNQGLLAATWSQHLSMVDMNEIYCSRSRTKSGPPLKTTSIALTYPSSSSWRRWREVSCPSQTAVFLSSNVMRCNSTYICYRQMDLQRNLSFDTGVIAETGMDARKNGPQQRNEACRRISHVAHMVRTWDLTNCVQTFDRKE